MLVAFIANGCGPFGLKILAEKSLARSFHYQYLALWYATGGLLALAAFFRLRTRPRVPECLYGAGMGLASFGGQLSTSLSLEHGIQGRVAFPVTTGGSLVVVAAVGILLFRERIGVYGVAGIVSGVLALVLLSI
jgi:multidrug transporter EmrE-like cation transporter